MKRRYLLPLIAGLMASESYSAEKNKGSHSTDLEGKISVSHISDFQIVTNNYHRISYDDYYALMNNAKNTEPLSLLEREKEIRERYFCNLASIFSVNFVTNNGKDVSTELTCGNGIYINKEGYLLTAAHLFYGKSVGRFALSFSNEAECTPIVSPVNLICYSIRGDLALCKSDGTNIHDCVQQPSIRNAPAMEGQKVISISFNYHSRTGSMQTGVFSLTNKIKSNPFESIPFDIKDDGPTITVKTDFNQTVMKTCYSFGEVLSLNEKREETEGECSFTGLVPVALRADKGNSGSAVFDEEGNIIGILVIGDKNVNEGEMAGHEAIRDFIRQYYDFRN